MTLYSTLVLIYILRPCLTNYKTLPPIIKTVLTGWFRIGTHLANDKIVNVWMLHLIFSGGAGWFKSLPSCYVYKWYVGIWARVCRDPWYWSFNNESTARLYVHLQYWSDSRQCTGCLTGNNLTLRKIAIWLSKNCQKFSFFSKKIANLSI